MAFIENSSFRLKARSVPSPFVSCQHRPACFFPHVSHVVFFSRRRRACEPEPEPLAASFGSGSGSGSATVTASCVCTSCSSSSSSPANLDDSSTSPSFSSASRMLSALASSFSASARRAAARAAAASAASAAASACTTAATAVLVAASMTPGCANTRASDMVTPPNLPLSVRGRNSRVNIISPSAILCASIASLSIARAPGAHDTVMCGTATCGCTGTQEGTSTCTARHLSSQANPTTSISHGTPHGKLASCSAEGVCANVTWSACVVQPSSSATPSSCTCARSRPRERSSSRNARNRTRDGSVGADTPPGAEIDISPLARARQWREPSADKTTTNLAGRANEDERMRIAFLRRSTDREIRIVVVRLQKVTKMPLHNRYAAWAFSRSHFGEYVTSSASSFAASTKSCMDKPPMACVVRTIRTSR